jgi:hypothetical protein
MLWQCLRGECVSRAQASAGKCLCQCQCQCLCLCLSCASGAGACGERGALSVRRRGRQRAAERLRGVRSLAVMAAVGWRGE